MTREEIIDGLKAVRTIHNGNYAPQIDEAIKLLEKENILDKIRDEIADLDDADYDFEGYYKAVNDALNIIDKYKAESKEPSKWISVSERLPKKDEEVFVYLFRKQPYIAWHDGVDWCTNDFKVDKDDEPLAWMPLPQPYKTESEDKE